MKAHFPPQKKKDFSFQVVESEAVETFFFLSSNSKTFDLLVYQSFNYLAKINSSEK